jgi:hypothetical protein
LEFQHFSERWVSSTYFRQHFSNCCNIFRNVEKISTLSSSPARTARAAAGALASACEPRGGRRAPRSVATLQPASPVGGGAWSGLPRHQGSRATADLAGLAGAVGGGQGCSHGGARATPAAVEAGEKAEEAAMARVHAEGQWVTVKGGDGFTGGR